MKTSKISIVAIISMTAGVASAQDFRGAATLGYGHSSVSDGGGDFSTFTGDAIGTLSFDNGLHWGLDAKYYYVDPDDVSSDVTVWDLGTTLNYQFNSGGVLGGYLDYADAELDTGLGFDLSTDITSYGISGGYVAEGVGVEAWIGESTTSPSLPGGADWTDIGALFRYQLSDSAAFGGHYVRSEISGSGADLDLYSIGLGGYYQFASGWGTYAGLVHQSFSDLDTDLTTFGVGVDYNLLEISPIPAQFSLELARTDIDVAGTSGDIDTIRVGLTFPLGDRSVATPLNSVARAAMAPRHNALTTLTDTAF
ncbi:hypothetical protein [Ruegeria atlantica]|uniref:hypothetical protein n=1 Tax=Ruegeria atlantica TaxID=81569 RepID=UPI00147E03C3|nr:hypothetical protein [Ruegeria atlantica]